MELELHLRLPVSRTSSHTTPMFSITIIILLSNCFTPDIVKAFVCLLFTLLIFQTRKLRYSDMMYLG